MRCSLIITPRQRGDLGSADSRTVSIVLLHTRSAKPLKRFRPTRSPNTQLKLGVNKRPLSNSLLQLTRPPIYSARSAGSKGVRRAATVAASDANSPVTNTLNNNHIERAGK